MSNTPKPADAQNPVSSAPSAATIPPAPAPPNDNLYAGSSLRCLPNTQIPAIVFVNTGSGGRKGGKIILAMEKVLGKAQVCRLPADPRIMHEYTVEGSDGSTQQVCRPHPEMFFEPFLPYQSSVRVIVCGGDGTMAWILNALGRISHERGSFPIAMMPLGTGNDLSRQFHWGAEFNRSMRREPWLAKVANATRCGLDRWRTRFAVIDQADATEDFKAHLPATFTVGKGTMNAMNKVAPLGSSAIGSEGGARPVLGNKLGEN